MIPTNPFAVPAAPAVASAGPGVISFEEERTDSRRQKVQMKFQELLQCSSDIAVRLENEVWRISGSIYDKNYRTGTSSMERILRTDMGRRIVVLMRGNNVNLESLRSLLGQSRPNLREIDEGLRKLEQAAGVSPPAPVGEASQSTVPGKLVISPPPPLSDVPPRPHSSMPPAKDLSAFPPPSHPFGVQPPHHGHPIDSVSGFHEKDKFVAHHPPPSGSPPPELEEPVPAVPAARPHAGLPPSGGPMATRDAEESGIPPSSLVISPPPPMSAVEPPPYVMEPPPSHPPYTEGGHSTSAWLSPFGSVVPSRRDSETAGGGAASPLAPPPPAQHLPASVPAYFTRVDSESSPMAPPAPPDYEAQAQSRGSRQYSAKGDSGEMHPAPHGMQPPQPQSRIPSLNEAEQTEAPWHPAEPSPAVPPGAGLPHTGSPYLPPVPMMPVMPVVPAMPAVPDVPSGAYASGSGEKISSSRDLSGKPPMHPGPPVGSRGAMARLSAESFPLEEVPPSGGVEPPPAVPVSRKTSWQSVSAVDRGAAGSGDYHLYGQISDNASRGRFPSSAMASPMREVPMDDRRRSPVYYDEASGVAGGVKSVPPAFPSQLQASPFGSRRGFTMICLRPPRPSSVQGTPIRHTYLGSRPGTADESVMSEGVGSPEMIISRAEYEKSQATIRKLKKELEKATKFAESMKKRYESDVSKYKSELDKFYANQIELAAKSQKDQLAFRDELGKKEVQYRDDLMKLDSQWKEEVAQAKEQFYRSSMEYQAGMMKLQLENKDLEKENQTIARELHNVAVHVNRMPQAIQELTSSLRHSNELSHHSPLAKSIQYVLDLLSVIPSLSLPTFAASTTVQPAVMPATAITTAPVVAPSTPPASMGSRTIPPAWGGLLDTGLGRESGMARGHPGGSVSSPEQTPVVDSAAESESAKVHTTYQPDAPTFGNLDDISPSTAMPNHSPANYEASNMWFGSVHDHRGSAQEISTGVPEAQCFAAATAKPPKEEPMYQFPASTPAFVSHDERGHETHVDVDHAENPSLSAPTTPNEREPQATFGPFVGQQGAVNFEQAGMIRQQEAAPAVSYYGNAYAYHRGPPTGYEAQTTQWGTGMSAATPPGDSIKNSYSFPQPVYDSAASKQTYAPTANNVMQTDGFNFQAEAVPMAGFRAAEGSGGMWAGGRSSVHYNKVS